jgi:hypothetical protein
MAGLLWLVWTDLGLPLDSLPWVRVEIRTGWLIALSVPCCDPLAVALTAAPSAR